MNLRGGIAQPHALEVLSTFQPLKSNSERALTPAIHSQSRFAATVHLWLPPSCPELLNFATVQVN